MPAKTQQVKAAHALGRGGLLLKSASLVFSALCGTKPSWVFHNDRGGLGFSRMMLGQDGSTGFLLQGTRTPVGGDAVVGCLRFSMREQLGLLAVPQAACSLGSADLVSTPDRVEENLSSSFFSPGWDRMVRGHVRVRKPRLFP